MKFLYGEISFTYYNKMKYPIEYYPDRERCLQNTFEMESADSMLGEWGIENGSSSVIWREGDDFSFVANPVRTVMELILHEQWDVAGKFIDDYFDSYASQSYLGISVFDKLSKVENAGEIYDFMTEHVEAYPLICMHRVDQHRQEKETKKRFKKKSKNKNRRKVK